MQKVVFFFVFFFFQELFQEVLWWLSGKESTFQCRRHGFNPGSGKIPHAMEQLSPCATTVEPVLQSLRAATTEA